MRKLFIHSGGGLGDHISHYFGYPEWRTLKHIKEQNTDIYVKVISYSANASVSDFYNYNPYIDKVEFFDIHNNRKNEYRLLELSKEFEELSRTDLHQTIVKNATEKKIILEEPELYLSPKEEIQYNELIKNDFICIHPFAGSSDRITISEAHLKILIDKIIEELKVKVIVIGGAWNRVNFFSTLDNKIEDQIIEEFDYQRDGLINLVNKTSTRLSTKLSMQAKGFIGNYSGPILAAWIAKIKSICYVSEAVGKASPQDEAPYTIAAWPILWQLPFNKTVIFHDNINQHEVIQQTLDWLKEKSICHKCKLWAPWGIRKIF